MTNPTARLSEDRIPVIVGVGEIADHPKDLASGLEPLSLLVEALRRAEADSGGQLLGEIQSLDIVNFLSWRYRDPARQLSERLRIKPAHACYGPVGGESPIRYLHEAAQRLFQQGEGLEALGNFLRTIGDFADADNDGNAVVGDD